MSSRVTAMAKLLRRAMFGAALLLAGCEAAQLGSGGEPPPPSRPVTAPPPPPPPPAPRVARASPVRPQPARDIVVEVAPDARSPSEGAAPPQRDEAPASTEAASRVQAQAVVGLTENALATWLGPPAESREELPARIWRYQGAGCALYVFLYLDLVSREFRALRFEVKGSENDDQRCLRPFFAGRGDAPHATARRAD
jgi:hypothetical protein